MERLRYVLRWRMKHFEIINLDQIKCRISAHCSLQQREFILRKKGDGLWLKAVRLFKYVT